MSNNKLAKLIYLTGSRHAGYTVITSGFEGCLDLPAPNVGVGNAIVRGLREHARQMMKRHPADHLFPPSWLSAIEARK